MSAIELSGNPGELEVARLDYSKPPPGYEVGNRSDEDDRLVVADFGEELRSFSLGGITPWAWNDPSGLGMDSCGDADSHADALAAAWAHYKERSDPPGMRVDSCEDSADDCSDASSIWHVVVCVSPRNVVWWQVYLDDTEGDSRGESEARAAAWAWYDRRLTLAERHAERAHFGLRSIWPRCLTWSDEQVSEVERWLVDSTAEMPEVLRG